MLWDGLGLGASINSILTNDLRTDVQRTSVGESTHVALPCTDVTGENKGKICMFLWETQLAAKKLAAGELIKR